ncbi:unnamed protein product [Vicia faba]|uniref:RING-type domain-containing protein n=1 Tax=Vicia faba TaxID=3906 RepID=A0AAV0YRY9_VICFA|nr:unnamed protein product [Vicia faba]
MTHFSVFCLRVKVLLDKPLSISNNPQLHALANEMKLEYDKYLSESNTLISIGAVLDPRYKMIFIKWVYSFLYPNPSQATTYKHELSNNLSSLFQLYQDTYGTNDEITSAGGVSESPELEYISGSRRRNFERAFFRQIDFFFEFLGESLVFNIGVRLICRLKHIGVGFYCGILKNIAKTGSLCCVASRPHGSSADSRDWSLGSHEPYWRTNTSYSPPPSRWDFRFQSEGLPYNLNDQLFDGSSTSSDGKESMTLVRGNHLYDLHYSASDGTGIFASNCSSELLQGPQWVPPAMQEISFDDYEAVIRKDPRPSSGRISLTPAKEETSENPNNRGSTSTQSESSESESTSSSRLSSRRNFSNHRSFISKPIHPLSFPDLTTTRDAFDPAAPDYTRFDTSNSLRGSRRSSNVSSSQDSADVTESFELETPAYPYTHSVGFRCGLCERYLSQRSPWSLRRIVRSGDMPAAGVLPCCHVFHAECLEQTTPKTRKIEPPCPVCVKLEEQYSPDQRGVLRSRNGFPKFKPVSEDGPSRTRDCAQEGDCVGGALPPHNAMFLLNRNRIIKNIPVRGNLSKEFPGKVKKTEGYSSQLFTGSSADLEVGVSSKEKAGPSIES